MILRILPPQTEGIGFLRRCPNCDRIFALRIDAEKTSHAENGVCVFRCKYCGTEAVFPKPRDPECL